jgi:hypothetical protein
MEVKTNIIVATFKPRSQNYDEPLLASSCLSSQTVRPHGTTRLPLEGFS